jgi:TonB family protein
MEEPMRAATHSLLCKLLAWASILLITASSALAQENAPQLVFDIPAQPLDAALNAYIGVSGAQVLYETALTAGRRSTQVEGRLAPDVALHTLLVGTGLVERRTDADAFIVTAAPEAQQTGASATAVARDSRFIGAVQAGILGALCGNPQTRPGGYKIAIEVWISPSGAVQRTELIGSTGDATRDAALGNALQGATVEAAPPAGMPQPLVMMIAPRQPNKTGDCAGQ